MTADELITTKGELSQITQSAASKEALSVFGMRNYAKMIAAATLRRFIYVCADISKCREAEEEFNALGLKTAFMPQKDDTLSCAVMRSCENDFKRLAAISAFITKKADVLITSACALCELYPKKEDFKGGVITLKKGEEHDIGDIAKRLTRLGYERCEQVTGKGSYAVRGDILDIWGIGDEQCVRVEFFGDEIDSIRLFSAYDQTAREDASLIDIYPATDVFIEEGEDGILSELNGINKSARLAFDCEHAKTLISGGVRSCRLSFMLPLCRHSSFSEFFFGETVVFDDCKGVSDNINVLLGEHGARFKAMLAAGDSFKFCYDSLTLPKVENSAGLIAFHRTDGANRLFEPTRILNVKGADIPDYSRDIPALAADIDIWKNRGYKVIVACGTSAAREKLRDAFNELKKGFGALLTDDFLPHGATFFESGIIIIGTFDIGKRAAKKVIKRTGRDAFVLPEVGDYVVHRVHGIGLCEDIKKLSFSGYERDYVVVRYAGDDKLYLPIENIDSLSKFVAGEHPKLSKIGGADFARLKEKVKQSVKDMALGLIELYAKRSEAKGHVYSDDDSLLDEFCADFPYSETEDQLIATAEGLGDLKSGKIMDRLLCGDVGFGKTEVAMRLAFKVICEGKQAAFVSPTTILANQHYETVCSRMEKFGIKAVRLTRMCSAAETKEALKALKEGSADIVCGTHRALGSDVEFKDLGLMILDEEQRFGVADKEKIKRVKTNVNVLSLSATPIPRTLHMSMTGIRDISILDTPPADRLPVQTFVTEYSEALVSDAISRELGRGGQVFVVYNKVADIDRFAQSIKALAPYAEVRVAHGQLNERVLSTVVEDFISGKANVLVSSTIIENGIDMPRANTMIVVDSERLGLSQMYQLRGRVGRSNRLAYVYFTYDPQKIMSETAYERLDAITRFTELSSGFKIAMRDLEIRGAGNILGRQQHGHIEKVGYDMYCKILQSAVDELKGEAKKEEKNDVIINCDYNAFVPENYVPDKEWRIRLYSKIAKLSSESECTALISDLNDIYGPPPVAVVNLVKTGLIKNLAARAGAYSVTVRGGFAQLNFASVKDLPEYATTYIATGKGVSFTSKEVRIKFSGRDCMRSLTDFLVACRKK